MLYRNFILFLRVIGGNHTNLTMVGVADLATGFKMPSPPRDNSRVGRTRCEVFKEMKMNARSKGEAWLQVPTSSKRHSDNVTALLKKVKMSSKYDIRCLKQDYDKAIAKAHIPVSKSLLRCKSARPYPTKPCMTPSSVGEYDSSLRSKCLLKSIWISPDQPSGLDSYEIPLYSAFSKNKIFKANYPKQRVVLNNSEDLGEGILQCFAYVRNSEGKWRCQKKRPSTCRNSTATADWLDEMQRPKTEEILIRTSSSSALPPQPPATRRPSSCGTKRTISSVIPTHSTRRLSLSTSILESTPGHCPTSAPTDAFKTPSPPPSRSTNWLADRPQSE